MIEIRSFRRVFELERRIYAIDRLRLNPTGVPLRGCVYVVALLAGAQVCTRLPLLDLVARIGTPYLWNVLLPLIAGAGLAMVRVEGRTFHLTALAGTRLLRDGRRLTTLRRGSSVGAHWHPPALVLLADGSEARMRRLRYRGPGSVLVTVAHEPPDGHGVLRGQAGGAPPRWPRLVAVEPGASLTTRPAA